MERDQRQVLALVDQLNEYALKLENAEARYADAQKALIEIEEKYRVILNNCNDALFVYHVTEDGVPGKFIEVNELACRRLGYLREELLEMSVYDMAAPLALPGIPTLLKELLEAKEMLTESIHIAKNGAQVPVEISCQLFSLYGKPTVLTIARDLTERKKAEEQLKESQEHFRTLFETVWDGIFIMDDNGIILEANDSLAKMYGYKRSELIGMSIMTFIPEDMKEVSWDDDVRGRIRQPMEARIMRKDGTLLDVEIFGQRNEYKGQEFRVTVVRDITERKKAEEAIHYQATHDCLTGVANRSLFFDRLRQALAQAERNESLVAVLFVDLDGFKETNDQYGHAAGDTLLKAVAQRLSGCTRQSDTVARLGGDEFAVIETNLTDADGATTLAEKLVEALSSPFAISGSRITVSASVGITVYPLDGGSADDLVSHADSAMYRVKSEGGNAFTLSDATRLVRGSKKGKRPA